MINNNKNKNVEVVKLNLPEGYMTTQQVVKWYAKHGKRLVRQQINYFTHTHWKNHYKIFQIGKYKILGFDEHFIKNLQFN